MVTNKLGEVDLGANYLASDSDFPFLKPVSIQGVNQDLDPLTSPETLWEVGGVYDPPENEGPVSVTSSEVGDVGILVFLDGVDREYNYMSEVVVVLGTAVVQTTQNFFRLNTIQVIGPNEPTGVISGLLDGKDAFVLTSTYNRALQAIYTVPAGYSLFINLAIYGTLNNDQVTFTLTLQSEGNVKQHLIPVFINETTNSIQLNGLFIAEKTTITVEGTASSLNNEASGALGGKLIDNSLGNFIYGG